MTYEDESEEMERQYGIMKKDLFDLMDIELENRADTFGINITLDKTKVLEFLNRYDFKNMGVIDT